MISLHEPSLGILKQVDYVNNNAQISNGKIKKNSLLNTKVLQLVSSRIVYIGHLEVFKTTLSEKLPEVPKFLHFPETQQRPLIVKTSSLPVTYDQ